MTVTSDQDPQDRWDVTFDAAREFIRRRHQERGCVIGIAEVLEHLDEVFGETAGLTSDVGRVLALCVDLWADPNIHQVADGWIEFWWIDPDRQSHGGSEGLHTRLAGQSDTEEFS